MKKQFLSCHAYRYALSDISNFFILFLVASLLLSGCKKDENPSPPTISLLSGPVFTTDKSVIPVGGRLYFGIQASGPSANITNLVIKKIMPDGSSRVVLDSGMNSSGFMVNETFFQSVEQEARWTFQIMDRNRQFATTAMTLYKDPNSTWGGIFDYPLLVMGYQNNTGIGQFLCPASGKVYTVDSANLNPELIDIVTYYYVDDNIPSATFSSPGETGGGITDYYPTIGTWAVKHYTKWDVSVDTDPIPVSEFDACHNDSLLTLAYDDVWGKRKFKWAEPGDIIPFMTSTGKKGLIKVLAADHHPAGKITFSMKIQQ